MANKSAGNLVASLLLFLALAGFLVWSTEEANRGAMPLPIDHYTLHSHRSLSNQDLPRPWRILNLFTRRQLWEAVRGGGEGLVLDLGQVRELADGGSLDPKELYGTAWLGPYPFEAAESRYPYRRFRLSAPIADGRALLPVGMLCQPGLNSEGWRDRGVVAVRLHLRQARPGADRDLGVYDTMVAFKRTPAGYAVLPWLVEGPLVNQVASEDPGRVVITFITSRPVEAAVRLADGSLHASPSGQEHQVVLKDLKPDQEHAYQVLVGGLAGPKHHFRTAPAMGQGPVTFGFLGDSRAAPGGGDRAHMGINLDTLSRLSALAKARQCRFLAVGGDMVNGYSMSPEDLAGQLHAFKQALAGFWASAPVYPVMGNHEAVLRFYDFGLKTPVRVDQWPYALRSAEAVFAAAFSNPANGPLPSNPRRPDYLENVYSYQYGPLKMIALNNNYWAASHAHRTGGSPQGYMLPDQLEWLERELAMAERDPSVRYVMVYAQEPLFPCGGHVGDAMWHGGDNRVRAWEYSSQGLRPLGEGMLQVRNRLVRAFAASAKVVAVLASDEHAYHRLLIDKTVPVGDPDRDDANHDGRIDWQGAESASPLPGLPRPVWYLTSGGAGAPYYSEQPAPWSRHWQLSKNPGQGYRFSSQENLLLFEVTDSGVALTVLNPHGEVIDQVANLAAHLPAEQEFSSPKAAKDKL